MLNYYFKHTVNKTSMESSFTYRCASSIGASDVGGAKEVSKVLVCRFSVTTGEFVWEVLLKAES